MTSNQAQVLQIARVVRAATAMLGSCLGGEPPPEERHVGGDLPDRAILRAVRAILSGRANSPGDLSAALADGDGDRRAFRPYEELSPEERRKRALIRAIVVALVDGPCSGDCHDSDCEATRPHPCHLDTCLSEFGVPESGASAVSGHAQHTIGHSRAVIWTQPSVMSSADRRPGSIGTTVAHPAAQKRGDH